MQRELKQHAWWIATFLILTATLTVPFVVVHEPPLLDYANHLARTFVLSHIHDPAFTFSKYYEADWRPYPYILWDVLVVALQQFLPVAIAGKLVLILNTALLPVAVAWFLRQANPGEMKLAFLACALSYYTLFLWGFTAYQLGLSFCFLMLGTWFWYVRKPSLLRGAFFAALSLATYLAHAIGFAAAAFILGLYELTAFNWSGLFRLGCFFLPPSLLFLWARPGLSRQSAIVMRPMVEKFAALKAVPTMGYDSTLSNIFAVGLVLCLLIALVRNPALRVNWRWFAVAIGLFLIYMALPYGWGESFDIDVRLIPPLCLLSLAVLRVGRRATWIAVLAIALVAVRVIDIATGFRSESSKSAVMNGAIQYLPRNVKIFPLVDTCTDDDPLDDYYIHYWAYSVIRRGDVSPYLFDVPGQTPMRITDDAYTPLGYWDHCYDEEPDWQLVARDYDYIWRYGDTRYDHDIEHFAEKVFAGGPLVLYRIDKQQLEGEGVKGAAGTLQCEVQAKTAPQSPSWVKSARPIDFMDYRPQVPLARGSGALASSDGEAGFMPKCTATVSYSRWNRRLRSAGCGLAVGRADSILSNSVSKLALAASFVSLALMPSVRAAWL